MGKRGGWKKGEDLVERFWRNVDRSGGPDACWPYQRARDKDGYGRFQYGTKGKQRSVRAHRYAFSITNDGAEPPCVMHRCDNPPCCNPTHLVAGTQAENRADSIAKGRSPLKLTDAAVLSIRSAFASGDRQIDLARQHGVSPVTIHEIVRGKKRSAA